MIHDIREEEKVFTYIIFNSYSIQYISIKLILMFINFKKLYYIFLDSMNKYAPLQ